MVCIAGLRQEQLTSRTGYHCRKPVVFLDCEGGADAARAALGFEAREQALGVLLEDALLLLVGQPLDALDRRLDVVVRLAGDGVFPRTAAGAFGAEDAPVGSDDVEEQIERLLVVDARIEPK